MLRDDLIEANFFGLSAFVIKLASTQATVRDSNWIDTIHGLLYRFHLFIVQAN